MPVNWRRRIFHTVWEDIPRLVSGHYRSGLSHDHALVAQRAPAPHPPRIGPEVATRILDSRSFPGVLSERSYPVLAHIVRLCAERPRSVFDFGGSIGTHYAEALRLISADRIVRWVVCELPEIAAVGADEAKRRGWANLTFSSDAQAMDGAEVVLASGVIQLAGELFFSALTKCQRRPKHILVATAELTESPTFYSIQRAPSFLPDYRGIVMTSYNRSDFLARFASLGYRIHDAWSAPPHRPVLFREETVVSSGFALEMND